VAFKLFTQVHRTSRLKIIKTLIEPAIFANISLAYASQHRHDSLDISSFFGNRIMVLKPPLENGERGVLLVMYSELFKVLPEVFDMKNLLSDYRLVLETSWAGNCDEDIIFFKQYDESIFVFSPDKEDFDFLKRLDSNLIPLRMGSRDWVDPTLYDKYCSHKPKKIFDIVMNAHWGWGKRHHILFKCLKRFFPDVKVALIGFPWRNRYKKDILDLACYYGIENQLDIFEDVPYEDVIKITSQSKIGILLSLKEGSNRAIPECLFCNVPAIVLDRNIGGVKDIINPMTGAAVTERALASEINKMINNYHKLDPRSWALENISCFVTTNRLNECIKKHALSLGHPWTVDIAIKTNSPDPRYFYRKDEDNLQPYNIALNRYLITY
jgi:hypothetical protein